MGHYIIKEQPEDERPVEKCMRKGPEALSDAELLAVVIRTGTRSENAVELAYRILNIPGNHSGLRALYHLSLPELKGIPGIGTVKAVQLRCLAEISRRIAKEIPARDICMTNPGQIADYFMEDMRHKEREELRVVLFDTKSQYIHDTVLFTGTVNASLISPREIFIEAFRYQAVFFCLLHNHPSGNPDPSSEDIQVTKRLKEAGDLIGIKLIDHIIIADRNYTSLKKQGYL